VSHPRERASDKPIRSRGKFVAIVVLCAFVAAGPIIVANAVFGTITDGVRKNCRVLDDTRTELRAVLMASRELARRQPGDGVRERFYAESIRSLGPLDCEQLPAHPERIRK
jgi:hypothetical protein